MRVEPRLGRPGVPTPHGTAFACRLLRHGVRRRGNRFYRSGLRGSRPPPVTTAGPAATALPPAPSRPGSLPTGNGSGPGMLSTGTRPGRSTSRAAPVSRVAVSKVEQPAFGGRSTMSYIEVPGVRVPIRMWTDPAIGRGRRMQQLRNVGDAALDQGPRRDAGRPLRQGRDGRLGDRHAAARSARRRWAWTSAAGCRRSRPRSRPTTCRATCPGCGRRSSRRFRWAGACTTTRSTRGGCTGCPTARVGRLLGAVRRGRGRGQVPAGAGRDSRWERSAAATTSSRSASIRAGFGLADAALRFPEHRQGARRVPHRRGPEAAAQPGPGRPRPGGVHRGHPADGGLPQRPVLGAGVRQVQPRDHDGAASRTWSARSSRRRRSTFEPEISCHHNYVAEERYDGMDLLVTRKGAIRAGRGEYGIIPGSMGTGSYIVKGLGNATSFNSASHGAGRRMSRNAAKRRFSTQDLEEQTAGRGVPQGLRRRGRDPGRVQADRAGHGPAAGPGRGRGEAQAGRLREGLTDVVPRAPRHGRHTTDGTHKEPAPQAGGGSAASGADRTGRGPAPAAPRVCAQAAGSSSRPSATSRAIRSSTASESSASEASTTSSPCRAPRPRTASMEAALTRGPRRPWRWSAAYGSTWPLERRLKQDGRAGLRAIRR